MHSPVTERFLRYVQIDTQSDPESPTVPSSEKQKDLCRLLVDELQALGLEDACMDVHGYVYATIPSTLPEAVAERTPIVALLAHVDTSPDESGAGVRPIVHPPYDGGVVTLPGDPSVRLDPAERPQLLEHVGERLITSDGTTLLGSDDKAGVAILMQLAEDLLNDAETPRPRLRLCFTVDEEIGRGVDHLDLERLGADVAYTVDGSGTNTVYAETFNAAEAVLDVRGRTVHPGYARGIMVNAARIMAEMIAALPVNEAPETTEGREGYIHPHTLSESDTAHARAKLILRDFSAEGLQRRKAYLEALAALFRVKYPGAGIELTITDQYKNMRSYIDAADPRAVSFVHRAAKQMGITLAEEVVRGGTDGARLSEMGIPTPNIFNGGQDYHSRFEWNTVENLEQSLAFTRALVRYWGEHGTERP